MSELLGTLLDFGQDNWTWLLIGVGLVVLLWLTIRVSRDGAITAPRFLGKLAPVLEWYARSRAARRLTVNAIGAAIVVWLAQTLALWVQPALTPDQLFTTPVVGAQAVEVVTAQQQPLEARVTYTGSVQPFQEAVIYARVEGWIDELMVYPGDPVKRGEVLTILETSALEPRMEQATADLAFWRAEFERDQRLFEAGAISGSQFDRTRQQYQTAQASVHTIETEMEYATVRAPFDGNVAERKIYAGVYVKPGEPLLKVDQLDRVRVQFEVAEKDLLWMQPGTTAYLSFPQVDAALLRNAYADAYADAFVSGDEQAGTNPRIRAEVSVVFSAEDPMTRTGLVEVHLPNPGGLLKSNTYVVGDLVRRRVEDAVVIPAAALTPVPDGEPVMFVGPLFADEGAAERREVRLGLEAGRYVQVLEGIEPGEPVITRGNRTLTTGQTVRVVRRLDGLESLAQSFGEGR